MKIMLDFEDKWIDADIINPPYNDTIDICYYGVCNDYDNNKYYYENGYRLILCPHNQIYDITVNAIFKWKPVQKLETNG